MKVVQNRFSNLILARGFAAVTAWPFIFVRTDVAVNRQLLTHERIHGRQQLEMLWLIFFLWYGIEWLIRLCIDHRTAYRMISFEQEAYRNDWNLDYPAERKPYCWLRFLTMKGGTNE